VLSGAPLTVLVAAALPAALGVVSAVLRWSALVDMDRSTSLRFPGGAGLLLLVTGPAHAALTAVAAWRALPTAPPLPLRPSVGLDEAAA
jgi:hypothetical protein